MMIFNANFFPGFPLGAFDLRFVFFDLTTWKSQLAAMNAEVTS
jgi:hypothetical protein